VTPSQLQSENLVKAINMIEANRAGNSNGRTTRGFVPGVCTNLNINIDTVYNALKKRKVSASSSEFLQPLVDSSTTPSNDVSKERNKGGRPKGSTIKSKNEHAKMVEAAKVKEQDSASTQEQACCNNQ
jgi:hypothetical protein